jgi:5-hydroxyisourate hydrolase
MTERSPITTHVLDTSLGRPAAGVAVELHRLEADGAWRTIGQGNTGSDGRLADLLPPGTKIAGRYRLSFATGEYFQARGGATFFPAVCVEFDVAAPGEHYHVPLLVSPFGYSTYRGS